MPLAINELALTYFRNYAYATLKTEAEHIILTGSNGAGKTNILEAISLLSPGRGLRQASLSSLRKHDDVPQPWVVSAQLQGLCGQVQIGTSPDPQAERESRVIHIDGERVRQQQALVQHVVIVWQTPQMDGLFTDSGSQQRAFLDRLAYGFDPAHLQRVNSYQKTMRERNKLLQQPQWDSYWLEALEAQMAQYGVAMALARRDLLMHLRQHMPTFSDVFPTAELELDTQWAQSLELAAGELEEHFQQALEAGRARDAAAGRSLIGPHRDALHVQHILKDMPASLCSTGEQKALLLSLLLAYAQARKQWLGAAPIILLDEVVAHLDLQRRSGLAEALRLLEAQAWLTGTDAADFSAFYSDSQMFEIAHGKIQAKTVENAQKC